MTVFVLTEQQILFGGYRLTSQTNDIAEALVTAELDQTVFGGDTMLNEPGLKGYGFSAEGLWAATEDAGMFGYHRTRNVPVTLALTTGAGGTPVRSVQAMLAEHGIVEGEHGELAKVSLAFAAMDAPVRGYVLHNASATGNVTGTAYNLGAPSSQNVYGVLHVFSGTGNLDVTIQSATDEAFTSPNNRIAFTQVGTGTPRAYQWATPIATGDAWWRAIATNPNTRDFAVVVAIQ
jgi:hypothetical protein